MKIWCISAPFCFWRTALTQTSLWTLLDGRSAGKWHPFLLGVPCQGCQIYFWRTPTDSEEAPASQRHQLSLHNPNAKVDRQLVQANTCKSPKMRAEGLSIASRSKYVGRQEPAPVLARIDLDTIGKMTELPKTGIVSFHCSRWECKHPRCLCNECPRATRPTLRQQKLERIEKLVYASNSDEFENKFTYSKPVYNVIPHMGSARKVQHPCRCGPENKAAGICPAFGLNPSHRQLLLAKSLCAHNDPCPACKYNSTLPNTGRRLAALWTGDKVGWRPGPGRDKLMELDSFFAQECGIQLTHFIDAYDCIAARFEGAPQKKPESCSIAEELISALDFTESGNPAGGPYLRNRRKIPADLTPARIQKRSESILTFGVRTFAALSTGAKEFRHQIRTIRVSRAAKKQKSKDKVAVSNVQKSRGGAQEKSPLERMFESTGYSFKGA